MAKPLVRPYLERDLAAVYDVCVRTADAGGDARGHYSRDDLVGDVFVGPYVVLEPQLAFVLDDGAGDAVGYVVGAADTADFVRRYREEWIPAVGERMAPVDGEPQTEDEQMRWLHHHPEHRLLPELAGYPAHLHVNILPGLQGRGFGRLLLERLFTALRAEGSAAVHLGMHTRNTAARAFYDRLGFHEIAVPGAGDVTYLGRSTAA